MTQPLITVEDVGVYLEDWAISDPDPSGKRGSLASHLAEVLNARAQTRADKRLKAADELLRAAESALEDETDAREMYEGAMYEQTYKNFHAAIVHYKETIS